MRGEPITAKDRERMIALARAGKSYRAIAAELSRPVGTVARVIGDAILCGVVPKRRQGRHTSAAT
jgi:hypothetical protein